MAPTTDADVLFMLFILPGLLSVSLLADALRCYKRRHVKAVLLLALGFAVLGLASFFYQVLVAGGYLHPN